MGKVARVIITETGKHYLMGKLIYEDALTSPKVPPILHQEVSRTFSVSYLIIANTNKES